MLEYPDDWLAVGTNDEYLFGDDLLIAPIVKDYDESRSVYLPRGTWIDYWRTAATLARDGIQVNAPLDSFAAIRTRRRDHSQPAGHAVHRPVPHRSPDAGRVSGWIVYARIL